MPIQQSSFLKGGPNGPRRLWEINQFSPDMIIVPQILLKQRNPYLAPVWVCLQTHCSQSGELETSVNSIGYQLGVNLNDRQIKSKLSKSLDYLQEAGIISVDKSRPRNCSSFFKSHIETNISAFMKSKDPKARCAVLYATDLTSYRYHTKEVALIHYINQLCMIRLGMKQMQKIRTNMSNPRYAELYHRYSAAVLREENLYRYQAYSAPPIRDMLDIYARAKVLAWAKYDCIDPATKEARKMIAIINDGCEDQERLDKAVRSTPQTKCANITMTQYSC